uniref:Fructose-bisphosphate aldolase n=1 Tax=Lygus hesperus TaxID=30085 RepID=A0A0A9Y4T3_LYGHE
MDGEHSLEICQYWTTKVITECYKALCDYNVILEGTLLKPNMVLPGTSCKAQATPEQIGRATLTALQRSVPVAVPAICFLSGGQSEEEATVNLNAINAIKDKRPWHVTFSFGRALQKSALLTWAKDPSNMQAVHEVFLRRCKANSEAVQGIYGGDAATSESKQSLFTKNYTY